MHDDAAAYLIARQPGQGYVAQQHLVVALEEGGVPGGDEGQQRDGNQHSSHYQRAQGCGQRRIDFAQANAAEDRNALRRLATELRELLSMLEKETQASSKK